MSHSCVISSPKWNLTVLSAAPGCTSTAAAPTFPSTMDPSKYILMGAVEISRKRAEQGSLSVVDVEVVAIWMAAHLIIKAPEGIEAVIFTDLQVAIRALGGERVGATPLLVNSASLSIRNAGWGAGGISVRLVWCPGHGGIMGSEAADAAAKGALNGMTIGSMLLPRKLSEFSAKKNSTTERGKAKSQNVESAREHWNRTATGIKY
ncbi:hypothetical protein BDV93DRAFT_510904 [Ceratobasidium sp. AG-I]|nr:hypothetical protein BDV93DRAFT_510904 [Ceratobasidium sp. AG-I]